jgi:predicted dithiol-disulfide oxidoreductase (DUF899 family)
MLRTHRAATRTSATCTMWIDGVNGVAQHIAQNIDVAVVAATDLKALRDHARARLIWMRALGCPHQLTDELAEKPDFRGRTRFEDR